MAKRGYRKYLNQPTTLFGITFDSRKEANHYLTLLDREQRGEIRDLKYHERWPLIVNGMKVAVYESDFSYTVVATGRLVVEDVKSEYTRKLGTYRLKRKLMKAIHDIDIVEV